MQINELLKSLRVLHVLVSYYTLVCLKLFVREFWDKSRGFFESVLMTQWCVVLILSWAGLLNWDYWVTLFAQSYFKFGLGNGDSSATFRHTRVKVCSFAIRQPTQKS